MPRKRASKNAPHKAYPERLQVVGTQGEAIEVKYQRRADSKFYKHTFKPFHEPELLLCVDESGRKCLLIQGDTDLWSEL